MLFDIRSPRRKNVIRVVYAFLALLIGGGLIAGTFGSGGGGGLLDTLFGNGSSGTANFDSQIQAAQKRVALNPQDAQAELNLVRVYVSAGTAQQDVDQSTGQTKPTTESTQNFQKAADAWDKYLKLHPKKVDAGAATLVARAYVSLAETSTQASEALINIQAAADAQKIVADDTPSQGSLSQLAIYLYFAGDVAAADAAAKKAEALAEPSQQSALKQQLATFKTNAAKFQQQVKAAEKQAKAQAGAGAPGAASGSSALSNPLQGGGGGLSTPSLGQ